LTEQPKLEDKNRAWSLTTGSGGSCIPTRTTWRIFHTAPAARLPVSSCKPTASGGEVQMLVTGTVFHFLTAFLGARSRASKSVRRLLSSHLASRTLPQGMAEAQGAQSKHVRRGIAPFITKTKPYSKLPPGELEALLTRFPKPHEFIHFLQRNMHHYRPLLTTREESNEVRGLTPPSSGRRKGRFAPFAPPLMSNVRPHLEAPSVR